MLNNMPGISVVHPIQSHRLRSIVDFCNEKAACIIENHLEATSIKELEVDQEKEFLEKYGDKKSHRIALYIKYFTMPKEYVDESVLFSNNLGVRGLLPINKSKLTFFSTQNSSDISEQRFVFEGRGSETKRQNEIARFEESIMDPIVKTVIP